MAEALCTIPSVRDSVIARKKLSNVDPSESDELWCEYCMDDPSIDVCAFCGCKKCFGKYDPDLLILCDRCERETHCYCMDPPLHSIPEEDPWYCECCRVEISAEEEEEAEETVCGEKEDNGRRNSEVVEGEEIKMENIKSELHFNSKSSTSSSQINHADDKGCTDALIAIDGHRTPTKSLGKLNHGD